MAVRVSGFTGGRTKRAYPLRVELPVPNPGLAEMLMGPELKSTMQRVASEARATFIAVAPKRSGALIASTVGYVNVYSRARGGPRWIANVRVKVPYGVWNQTGAGPGKHPRSTGNMPWFGPFAGAYTFNEVVKLMKAK